MTDKEKYTALMQRYWEAETTPAEERRLARYAARTDDPAFEELRGVLGYLSLGRAQTSRRAPARWAYSWAAVAAAWSSFSPLGCSPDSRERNATCASVILTERLLPTASRSWRPWMPRWRTFLRAKRPLKQPS